MTTVDHPRTSRPYDPRDISSKAFWTQTAPEREKTYAVLRAEAERDAVRFVQVLEHRAESRAELLAEGHGFRRDHRDLDAPLAERRGRFQADEARAEHHGPRDISTPCPPHKGEGDIGAAFRSAP